MLETNVFDYYAFGYNYHILRRNTEDLLVKGDDYNSLTARLDELLWSA